MLTQSRYCPTHTEAATKVSDERRGSSAERGYDAQWKHRRELKITENPLCERCLVIGKVIVAGLVHHKDRDPRNNESENLESLCVACHDAEHAQERWGGA